MPLKLKQPPPDDNVDEGTPAKQELTQGAIDRLRAQIDAFIDDLVAVERRRSPGLPPQALRALLMRRECPCTAAKRLLAQRP